jgi:hypothetical protein
MPEDPLQRLLDLEEIKQLKARYCRLVDAKEWDAFGALFTDDYHFESDGGVQNSRAEVVAMVTRTLSSATTIHHCHTPEITFTGPDTASGIWAMNDYCSWPSEGGEFVLRGYGHYHEDYVRTADGWRIARGAEVRLRVDTEGTMPSFAAEPSA